MTDQINNSEISDLQKDYLHDAIVSMDINYMYLVDKTHGCKGVHINVSHYFPTLALIFKTMLICALQERTQKLTVEFDDLIAYTTLNYSKRLETNKEVKNDNY